MSSRPNHPNYSQLGFRVHPPTPLKGAFLLSASRRSFAENVRFTVKRSWIIVGLWVLAACAGRSTRSKGSQQTLRLSHPVRVARKPAKNDFSETGQVGLGPAQKVRGLGTWRGRLFGQAQKASGPWNLPGWGLTRPPKLPKMFVLATFREHWRGRPRRTGAGGPGPWILPAWGPRPFWGGTPTPPSRPSDRHRRPRVPGFCQPGAPDPPGSTLPGLPGHTQKTKATPTVVGLGSFFIA